VELLDQLKDYWVSKKGPAQQVTLLRIFLAT